MKKLDVASARDTRQFIDAFRPVLDKVSAFTKNLQFTRDGNRGRSDDPAADSQS